MKNLIKRLITGIIYIGFIVGAILWGSTGVFILSLLFSCLGVAEFMTMVNGSPTSRTTWILDILGGLILTGGIGVLFLPHAFGTPWVYLLLIWAIWFLGRMIAELYMNEGNALINLSLSITSQIYVAMPLGLLNFINHYSGPTLMLMFILIWLNDTGAYIFGSRFGRHRLFERISPKKSWEGFAGGLVLSVGAAIAACFIFPHWFHVVLPSGAVRLPWGGWALFGIVVGVMATYGDLVESLIKRSIGIKDSGKILPGHGGILDRIDSLLFVTLASVLFLIIAVGFER